MTWPILESLQKKVHFLGDLIAPIFPSEINWPFSGIFSNRERMKTENDNMYYLNKRKSWSSVFEAFWIWYLLLPLVTICWLLLLQHAIEQEKGLQKVHLFCTSLLLSLELSTIQTPKKSQWGQNSFWIISEVFVHGRFGDISSNF